MLKTILLVLIVIVGIGILIGLCMGEAADEEVEIEETRIEVVRQVA